VSIKNCSFTWKLLVVGNLFSLFFNVLVWLTCHEHFNQAHILCTCGRLWVFIPFYRCPAFAFIMTATTKTIHCCRCCNFHNKAKKQVNSNNNKNNENRKQTPWPKCALPTQKINSPPPIEPLLLLFLICLNIF